MRSSRLFTVLLVAIGASSCMFNVPIPELAGQPKAVTPLFSNLDIPADLEVRDATIVPAVISDAFGTGGDTRTDHTTHYFFSIHAIHRRTGDQLLLVYESNDPNPPSLLRVMRLRPSADVQLPDPIRH